MIKYSTGIVKNDFISFDGSLTQKNILDNGPLVGSCTKFFNKSLTWFHASSKCANKGAHLAHISDEIAKQNLLKLIPEDSQTSVWIGYSDREKVKIRRQTKMTWSLCS